VEIGERFFGDTVVLDVTGRLVLGANAAEQPLRDAVDRALREGYRHVVLNLAGVAQVDTTGLTALVGAHIALTKRGGRLTLIHPTRRLRELLAMTRLDTVLELVAAEEANAGPGRSEGRGRSEERRPGLETGPDTCID
jgi:anti-sigma B factor antagonist